MPNNVANLVIAFEEIMKVIMTVFEGEQETVLASLRNGRMPASPFAGRHLIHEFEAEGSRLNDRVSVTYGKWATDTMARLRLVSPNAEVQFGLTSEYARSFRPYLDGLTQHRWVDEGMLAAFVGRDLWAKGETAQSPAHFRALCRQAFNDIKRRGGLSDWTEEVRGKGRLRTRRYHYTPNSLLDGGDARDEGLEGQVSKLRGSAGKSANGEACRNGPTSSPRGSQLVLELPREV